MPPTRAETWLRRLLIAHAVWSALAACAYVVGGETGMLGFLPNSFAKDVLFTVISALGAADVRRRGWLALVIAAGYLGLVAGQVATLAWGGAPDPDFAGLSATAALLLWMAADLALAAGFVALWWWAERTRHGLRYLDPVSFAALRALSEVAIEGRHEVLPATAVARNVDGYLAELKARGRWRVRAALLLVGLLPVVPLPALAPAARKRFLERRLLAPEATRRLPAAVRKPIQAAVRTAAQMAYLGYYGDRRTWASIGYTPYALRDGATPPPPPAVAPLRTLAAPPSGDRYDAIVIGSGAAGGILAARYAEAGRRVLVVERGPHVDPRDFGDDEVRQYLRLYNEGALQLATNFSLQVLQGMCVGGGTTINNGLCLAPPEPVLAEWAEHGIEPRELQDAIAAVRAWLRVAPIPLDATSPAARRFGDAIGRLGLDGRLELMEANIAATCRGSGYCNIGCAFDAKLGTLDLVLPAAQEAHPGRLDVLADFHAERIEHGGGGATAVVGRHAGRDRSRLEADEFVVAAGAIGSSALLLRSRLGGDRVGHGLHFNVNSPLTADFPDSLAVDAFAGIQMSHAYVAPGAVPPYLVENWFNPPATQALATPGWFDRHFELMHRFRHLACAGVLVGTVTPGRVTDGDGAFEFTLSDADRERLLAGLEVAARIMLEAGAARVMPATFAYQELAGDAVGGLADRVRRSGDLLMTSAHPQGGNALGSVVDADFRVAGAANVRVCDASVFPSSVRVNPQLTVMGLAELAARRILS